MAFRNLHGFFSGRGETQGETEEKWTGTSNGDCGKEKTRRGRTLQLTRLAGIAGLRRDEVLCGDQTRLELG